MSSSDVYDFQLNDKGNMCMVNQGVRLVVFNATFNNISVISWQPVLLVQEIGVPKKTTDLPTLSHNAVWSTPRLGGIQTHNFSGDRH